MSIKDIIREIRIDIIRFLTNKKPIIELESRSILLLAPHPDDEVIGCSGLIQQCLEKGKSVDVVILTGGGKSHRGCCDLKENILIENRRNLSRKAAEILCLPSRNLHFLDYADGSISFDCQETDKLKQLIDELQPDLIFVPHKGEGWSDHIETGNIVRKLIAGKNTIQLYEYCVWFWYYNYWKIDWKNVRILKMDSGEHNVKLKAISAYIAPLAPCGKPWSGVLPKVFLDANRWNNELYFKVN